MVRIEEQPVEPVEPADHVLAESVCREIYQLGLGIRTRDNESYFRVIEELGLGSVDRYRWLIDQLCSLGAPGESPDHRDPRRESLLLLGLVYTPTFFLDNIYPEEILRDIKYLTENLWEVVRYRYGGDDTPPPTPYRRCTKALEASPTGLVKRIDSMETLSENGLDLLLLDTMGFLLGVLHRYSMLSQLVNSSTPPKK